jgi:large subunit ribosomal protein L34
MKVNIRRTNIKQRKQGFLARMRTRGGRQVIKRQRAKGKKQLGK